MASDPASESSGKPPSAAPADTAAPQSAPPPVPGATHAPQTAPQPGGPPPRHGRARPLRTSLALFAPLLWVLLAGLATAAALFAAARWVLLTEPGTAWLVQRLPMVTEVRGLQGALLGPRWQIERLRMQWDGGRQWLELDDLRGEGMVWRWRPEESKGPWAVLEVDQLQLRRLHIETGPRGPRPIPLPAHLAPPLRLQVQRLSIGELRVDALEPVNEVVGESLLLDGSAGAQHRIERLSGRAYGVHAQATASLANTRPFDLQARAVVTPALVAEADAPPWAAALRLSGPLAAFDLQAVLRGRPLTPDAPAPARGETQPPSGPALDLRALVRPLEAWPVSLLVATTEGLDLSSLRGGAPRTRLSGEVRIQAAASTAPVSVQVRLDNAMPGRWDEQRLPASRIELDARGEMARPERVEFTRFELQLAQAGAAVTTKKAPARPAEPAGRIEGRALWNGHQIELDARLHELRPHRLDSRAPSMSLNGPLRLTFSGVPSPDPRVGNVQAAAPSASASASSPRTAGAAAFGVVGRIELEGRIEGAPRPVSVRAEGSANAAGVELRHLQVRAGDAQAVLRATVARNAAREWTLSSEGSLAEFDPLPWWPGEAGTPWRQGAHRLNAGWQFELRAPADAAQLPTLALLQRLAGTGRLRLHDSVLGGVPLAGEATLGYAQGASTNIRAAAGSLRAEFQIGGNRLSVTGSGDPQGSGAGDRWQGEIRAGNLASLAPLARLHPSLAEWVPRQGRVDMDFTAQGRWPRMASQGQVRSEALQVGTLSLARAQAGWTLDLTEAAAGEAPLAFDAQITKLRLGAQEVEQMRAELRGTRAQHRMELDATLPVGPGAGAARLLNVAGEGGTRVRLQAQGQWLPEAAGGGRWLARVDELDLAPAGASRTSASAPTAEQPRWADARNLRAQLTFDAQGQLQTLSAEPGRLRLADTFALRWEAVQLDFKRARADFALRADIEPFALAPLLHRLQPTLGWQGDLRLAAHVDIRAAERFEADMVFARLDGDLHVETQGELQLLGLTDFRLLLRVRDGLWDFEPVFRGRGLGEVRGRLRVRTTPERRWPHDDAPIEGQLVARVPDIGVWGHWVPPGWRLAGELATTAQLGGSFAVPTYTGELTGKGLAVRNLLQGVNLGEGRLLVRLAGSSAQIETFTLRGGEGRVDVTGQADLGAQPSARLKLVAERFRVLGRVDRMLTASGEAELALATDTSRLDGRFKIDEGLFDFTRADAPSLDEDVTFRGIEAETSDAASTDNSNARPRGQRFVLGVDVDLGQQLRTKGRGLDTGLTGAVRITNPGGRVTIRGRVESVRGTYAAYGQKLELERSTITFNGPPDNPWLDISAIRPNLDSRVGLRVTGALQGLRVRLFSDPEMTETDKLSWLVLGRASDGLGRNDTALLQRAAVALLAGEGEAPTDAFMRRLGIDELSLKQSDGDVRETVVSLGKQLSRRWYLGYERGVNATTGTWQLIYRAAQRFTLRAQSGLENSLDLIWTWRLQQPPAEGGVRKSLPAVPP